MGARRVTGGNTFLPIFFIPRTACCYVGDTGDVLRLDPRFKVNNIFRTLQFPGSPAELPRSLNDRNQVRSIDRGDCNILVVANIGTGATDVTLACGDDKKNKYPAGKLHNVFVFESCNKELR